MRAAAAVSLLFGACGNAAPDSPAIALGTGDTSFTPLVDGGAITAYMGPQGGFHVYLTLRAQRVDPGLPSVPPSACTLSTIDPCVDFVVTDVGSSRVLDTFVPLRLPLTANDAGVYELLPPRLVQLDIQSLAEVDGHLLRIDGTVTDAHGARASASLEATAVRFDRPDAGP